MLINGIRFNTTDGGGTGDGGGAGSNSGEANAGAGGSAGGTTLTQGSQGGTGGSAAGGGSQAGGSTVPDWASGLPDDIKSSASLANYKDLPSFVKSALEAEKLIGKKGIIKPGENATPEELNKYYNDLGRPEKAEGYQLKRPETWPDHLEFSDAMVPKVQQMFHEAGVPADMANKLWGNYHKMIAESAGEQASLSKADVDRGIAALKQEWGGEEKYKANVETAIMAVKEFGGDDLVNFLDSTGFGDHPALIKAFANAGKSLREDGFVGGGNNSGALTTERAKAEIEKLNNDKEFTKILYSNKLEDKSAQQEAKKKMENLYQIAYPTFTK